MNGGGLALFTDLYELTMLQAYENTGMRGTAVFDLFFRGLPARRNFLVACGLDSVLSYLETLSFAPEDLDYLRSLGLFSEAFLSRLETLRFTGDVRAVPEGTVVFPPAPILELEAPLPEAQLVETFLLNQLTFETMIASKGARAIIAARGRRLVDFGSRRAHGIDAARKAARALYLAGFDATSNVLAGKLYGIPVVGTMAHSYVEAHESELESYRTFAATYPEATLLIDTYDTLDGARRVVQLAEELGDDFRVSGVRLDSGDLGRLAFAVRRVLDEAGLAKVRVVASGGLDEYSIDKLVAGGAPIASFGVGTSAVVSSDAPAIDSAYKLVSYEGRARMKLSAKKATLPGKKQVFRRVEGGVIAGDVIALQDESLPGEPLLREVMRGGRRTPAGVESLAEGRERARAELARLPERLRALSTARPPYPVTVSERLRAEERRLRRALAREATRP